MTHWLVLPSPFLGAPLYAGLADALAHGGDTAAVATYAEPPAAAAVVAAWAEAARDREDVVLVPHSNAGNLAPLVSERCGGTPVVFVDAALPAASGRSPLVPRALLPVLDDLAEDGVLPRWTRWWPREVVGETLPGEWFDRVDAAVPAVPLAYAASSVDLPAGWERGDRAYLAFGDTYAEETVRAGALGWPVTVLEGARHAHCLLDPVATAEAVRALAGSFGATGRPQGAGW